MRTNKTVGALALGAMFLAGAAALGGCGDDNACLDVQGDLDAKVEECGLPEGATVAYDESEGECTDSRRQVVECRFGCAASADCEALKEDGAGHAAFHQCLETCGE